jgi:hypothetical protein
MNQQGLLFLNQAFVVLIPKKNSSTRVTDYRPIIFTHNFAKIVFKLLANRLGHELEHVVSINQIAFIKNRCIHDNFMYVQEALKELHKKKITGLFIKLDILKDIDSVNWSYLPHRMEYIGMGQRWRNWISALWCTASSSSFLLNGEPGKIILYCRGVRQGDPLSPMIFLLDMEPLHKLFKKAQDWGLLKELSPVYDTFRVSLYADDVAAFIRPSDQDLLVTNSILSLFAEVSGLTTNLARISSYLSGVKMSV